MILRLWAILGLGFGLGLCSGKAQENEKPNLSFGKTQDLEIELVTVPDSVGTGGKPAPTGADTKSSQEGRWLRIDVPFATEKKITPEVKFKFFLEGYKVVEGEKGAKDIEKFVVLRGIVTGKQIGRAHV